MIETDRLERKKVYLTTITVFVIVFVGMFTLSTVYEDDPGGFVSSGTTLPVASAEIDSGVEDFYSIADAYDNVKTGKKIQILQECDFSGLVVRKDVTIDLNGQTVHANRDGLNKHAIEVTNGAMLTIEDTSKGNGCMDMSAGSYLIWIDSGNLKFDDGKLIVKNKVNGIYFTKSDSKEYEIVINGGIFQSDEGYLIKTGFDLSGDEIKVSGGTFTVGAIGKSIIYNKNGNANIFIDGGEFNSNDTCSVYNTTFTKLSIGESSPRFTRHNAGESR